MVSELSMDNRWNRLDEILELLKKAFGNGDQSQKIDKKYVVISEQANKNNESRGLLGPILVTGSLPKTTTELTTARIPKEFLDESQESRPCRNQFLDEFLGKWASEIHKNEVNSFLSRLGFPSLPSFSGDNPKDWINGIEEYFDVYASMEIYQFSLVTELLVGRAKEWYLSWDVKNDKDFWNEFVEALCIHFGNVESNEQVENVEVSSSVKFVPLLDEVEFCEVGEPNEVSISEIVFGVEGESNRGSYSEFSMKLDMVAQEEGYKHLCDIAHEESDELVIQVHEVTVQYDTKEQIGNDENVKVEDFVLEEEVDLFISSGVQVSSGGNQVWLEGSYRPLFDDYFDENLGDNVVAALDVSESKRIMVNIEDILNNGYVDVVVQQEETHFDVVDVSKSQSNQKLSSEIDLKFKRVQEFGWQIWPKWRSKEVYSYPLILLSISRFNVMHTKVESMTTVLVCNGVKTIAVYDCVRCARGEVSPESLWQDLKPSIAYLSTEELDMVHSALNVVFEALEGQKRRSGEPFIIHPIEVARILGEFELDWESIAAGLLHDTVEDTNVVTLERIEEEFGPTVLHIVELSMCKRMSLMLSSWFPGDFEIANRNIDARLLIHEGISVETKLLRKQEIAPPCFSVNRAMVNGTYCLKNKKWRFTFQIWDPGDLDVTKKLIKVEFLDECAYFVKEQIQLCCDVARVLSGHGSLGALNQINMFGAVLGLQKTNLSRPTSFVASRRRIYAMVKVSSQVDEFSKSDVIVSRSIILVNFAKLREQVKAVELAGCDWIHVDVMDGCFVPNITIGPLVVDALRPLIDLPLDLQLVIMDPELRVEDFIKAGAVVSVYCELGLEVKSWVKTSLTPCFSVVPKYLQKSGLLKYLNQLGFNIVGYGCTTCFGNSGDGRKPTQLKESLFDVTWDDWHHFVNIQLVRNLHSYRVAEMVFLSWLHELFDDPQDLDSEKTRRKDVVDGQARLFDLMPLTSLRTRML